MTIYIHLVRHAQGYHNLNHSVHLPDPSLTPLGESQIAALQAKFPHHAETTHLIASPLRRTIQTCSGGFAPSVSRGLRIILLPKLQEFGPWPADTGSEPESIMAEFGEVVDVSRVEKGWNENTGIYRATVDGLLERGIAARREIQAIAREWMRRNTGDAHLIVVGHGAMLHFLADSFGGLPLGNATAWENAAYRTFTFVDETLGDRDARLVETDESWIRQFGEAPRLSEQENQAAFREYEMTLDILLEDYKKR